MFDVGGPELLLILVAVVLLFGPKKIPEISQMLGKGVQKIRQAQAQFQTQMSEIEKEVKSTVDPEVKHEPNATPPKEVTDKYVNNAISNEDVKNDKGFDEFHANLKKKSDGMKFVPKKPKHISDEELEANKKEDKKIDNKADNGTLSNQE